MELGSAYDIIWYDAHIGQKGQCHSMKTDFIVKLMESAALPPTQHDPEIDGRAMKTTIYPNPITFVHEEDQALELLETVSKLKKVYFITSGKLGKEIIPKILTEKISIYAYYIFCGQMSAYTEWGVECVANKLNIKMFDFETDLLIRLARDMSREFIREGEKVLNLGHPRSADKYFEYAYRLAERANEREKANGDSRHHPSNEHKRKLDGERGLIAQARMAMQINANMVTASVSN